MGLHSYTSSTKNGEIKRIEEITGSKFSRMKKRKTVATAMSFYP